MRNYLPVRDFRFIDFEVFINKLENMINTYNYNSNFNHRC